MDAEPRTLDARAFGLACGLLWAGGVVVLGIAARVGWGERPERLLADVYRGYGESAPGLAAGAVWAFLDGLAGGYAFAGRSAGRPAHPRFGSTGAMYSFSQESPSRHCQ